MLVTYPNVTSDFIVGVNDSHTVLVPHSYRVEHGVQEKGIYIDSDEPISVHMASDEYPGDKMPGKGTDTPLHYNFQVEKYTWETFQRLFPAGKGTIASVC